MKSLFNDCATQASLEVEVGEGEKMNGTKALLVRLTQLVRQAAGHNHFLWFFKLGDGTRENTRHAVAETAYPPRSHHIKEPPYASLRQ